MQSAVLWMTFLHKHPPAEPAPCPGIPGGLVLIGTWFTLQGTAETGDFLAERVPFPWHQNQSPTSDFSLKNLEMLRRLKPDPAIATRCVTLLKKQSRHLLRVWEHGWSPVGHRYYTPGRVFIASDALKAVRFPTPVFSYKFTVDLRDLCMYFQVLRKGLKPSNPIFKLQDVLN